jgi:hypothetical protein
MGGYMDYGRNYGIGNVNTMGMGMGIEGWMEWGWKWQLEDLGNRNDYG